MKIALSIATCLLFCGIVSAQRFPATQAVPVASPRATPTAEERAALEKKKAERRAVFVPLVASEVDALVLPENRAFANARLGIAIWRDDRDAAKDHFKRAVAELAAAQQMAENAPIEQKKEFNELLYGRSLRPSILYSIGSVDPELALDAFYRTRPLAVQKAMAGVSTSDRVTNRLSPDALIQNEAVIEQRLIRLLAAKDPEKGLALLKESIKKNLSPETLAQLREVWKVDPEAANSLAEDVVSRLTSRGFAGKDGSPISLEMVTLATGIVNDFLRVRRPDERSLTFEETGVRGLAVKLINLVMSRAATNAGIIPANQLEAMAKRFAPSSVAAVRQLSARTTTMTGLPVNQNAVKLAASGAGADTLINEAKTYPPEDRRGIYAAASQKLIEDGQFERAMALLTETYDEDSLPAELSKLAERQAAVYLRRGEFDAAEGLTVRMDTVARTRTMVALARALFAKDKEANRERAAGILERVRTSLPVRPQNSEDLRQILIVIGAMAPIATEDAMRNFEQIIDPINQVTEASAIVSTFQRNDRIRDGEFVITNGPYFGVQVDLPVVRSLAEQDPEKSAEILRGITRRELKVSLLLGILEGS